MTEAEVVALVRAIRYTPADERHQRRSPGINTISRFAGVSRPTLYQIARSGRASWQLTSKIGQAVKVLREQGAFQTLGSPSQEAPCAAAHKDDRPIRAEFSRFR